MRTRSPVSFRANVSYIYIVKKKMKDYKKKIGFIFLEVFINTFSSVNSKNSINSGSDNGNTPSASHPPL